MNKIKQAILGKSSATSIVGYLLAAVFVLDEMLKAGETDPTKIIIGVLMAVLGRVGADAGKVKSSNEPGDGPGPGTEPPKPPVRP